MSWRSKTPFHPLEWVSLVVLLAVLGYVAVNLWAVVAGGLPHLGEALGQRETRFALWLSLWTTTVSTLLCVLIGIPCAYLLACRELPGRGVFIASLRAALESAGLTVPVIGIKPSAPEALDRVRSLLGE